MADGAHAEWSEAEKKLARYELNKAVARGDLPPAREQPCTDCSKVWAPGLPRHEYDHHKGYAPENWLVAEPVCSKCHKARDSSKKAQTACKRGHAYTPENTINKPNGTRWCRECRKAYDRKRVRPPGYWKAVNNRRRGKIHG